MRVIFILLCVGLFISDTVAQQLYPMRKYDKWGYINEEGKWVIPPKYEMAMDFSDGLALVKDRYKGGEVWDVINEKGQKVVQSEYFGYGVFIKLFDYRITILPNQHYSEGLIPVAIEILDPNYSGASISGFLNKTGELELYGYYDKVFNFNEGLACVLKNGKYGYINKDGQYVINPVYIMSGSFSNGLAPAYDGKSGKWGYINTKGEWAIKPQFSKAKEFADGLAAVWKDFNWGYINKLGEYVIPGQYRVAENFSNGYAYVGKDNEHYFINKNGNKVFTNDLYQSFCFTRHFCNGAALIAIAPESRKCNTFELAEDVIIQDTNLLIYLNTKGEIFYRQEMEEYYSINKIRRP